MKLLELLNSNSDFKVKESFDSKANFDVVTHTSTKYQLEAMINDRKIKVIFSKIDSEPDGWDFEFYEQDKKGKWTTAKTDSGGEFKVFAFVGTALREFIDVYHPETIEFNAFEEDDSRRGPLYQKLIKKMNLNYDMEVGKSMAGNQHTFTLKRKD
jgi:hypothetical protein